MPTEYLNNKDLEVIIFNFQKVKSRKLLLKDIIENYLSDSNYVGLDEKNEIISYEECSCMLIKVEREYDELKDLLAEAFFKLSDSLTKYTKFSNIDPDDAIQEGVMICFDKIDRFNPNYFGKDGKKSKVFNYLTTCVLNHLRQMYRTSRNYHEFKTKYHDHLILKHDKFQNSKQKNKRLFIEVNNAEKD